MADTRPWRVWGDDLATLRVQIGHITRYRVFVATDKYGWRAWSETDLFIDRSRYGERSHDLHLSGGHPSGCALRLTTRTRLAEAISDARRQIAQRREQADA